MIDNPKIIRQKAKFYNYFLEKLCENETNISRIPLKKTFLICKKDCNIHKIKIGFKSYLSFKKYHINAIKLLYQNGMVAENNTKNRSEV